MVRTQITVSKHDMNAGAVEKKLIWLQILKLSQEIRTNKLAAPMFKLWQFFYFYISGFTPLIAQQTDTLVFLPRNIDAFVFSLM